jgi:hypothetical protein
LVLERSEVVAVDSLLETAFMPYASVKSLILFLRKNSDCSSSLLKCGRTFFAKADVVGRKTNGGSLLRSSKESGQLELDSDLPEILNLWKDQEDVVPLRNGVFLAEVPSLQDQEFATDGFRLDPAYHHPSRRSAIQNLKSSSYSLQSLRALCDLRNESTVPARQLEDEKLIYVGLANIEAYTGTFSPEFRAGATIRSTARRFLPGDILYSKMCPELRKVCLIPQASEAGFASSECLILVPRMNRGTGKPFVFPELPVLLLRSDLFFGQVVHLVKGIGRPRVSKSAVLKAKVPVPPLPLQSRLLELYNRSEEVARALVEGR